MNGNSRDLARVLRENPALMKRIMASPDGQALLRMLRSGDGGFQSAVRSAAKGDTEEIARRLRAVAESPDGAAVIARIRQAVEG